MKRKLKLHSPLVCMILISVSLLLIWAGHVTADDWRPVTSPVEIMQQGYIQVTAGSEANQTRYRAIRAATLGAQRDLLEAFKGVQIAGESTVREGMLESDSISSQVKGFLRGAIKCGEKYHDKEGYAEVCMRLYLHGRGGAYDVVLPILQQEGIVDKAVPKALPFESKSTAKPPTPAGPVTTAPTESVSMPESRMATPDATIRPQKSIPENDGLILDVSGLGFKPAMVNRIMTPQGELIFGPSHVVNTVLLERGCGGFTNQQAKAKGLLATWGSHAPMELKAVEVRHSTDAIIAQKDAMRVHSQDQKTGFLSQAKIVFVLK